ncbi:MAG: hypothetical protein ACKO4A_05305, partial [Gammaproteobacteria bacterium]
MKRLLSLARPGLLGAALGAALMAAEPAFAAPAGDAAAAKPAASAPRYGMTLQEARIPLPDGVQ